MIGWEKNNSWKLIGGIYIFSEIEKKPNKYLIYISLYI
jgi:hypothetical protein